RRAVSGQGRAHRPVDPSLRPAVGDLLAGSCAVGALSTARGGSARHPDGGAHQGAAEACARGGAVTQSNRRQLVMLVAFAAVLAAPVPWAVPALVGAAIAVSAFRTARYVLRRARSRAGAQAGAAIVLGTDHRGRLVAVSDRELSAHGLIVGASGAGKTTTLLRILTE